MWCVVACGKEMLLQLRKERRKGSVEEEANAPASPRVSRGVASTEKQIAYKRDNRL